MRKFKGKPFFFKLVARTINLFYHKRTYTGVENLHAPTIIITNHSQIHAPLTHTLFFPDDTVHFWCISDMMSYRAFQRHAFSGFWAEKPKSVRWLFKIASYLLVPVAWVFKRANTIAVYHDHRIKKTIEQTVKTLDEGKSIIICPEKWSGFDGIINDFHNKFVDVASIFYKKTGKPITFTPMYTCPALKTNIIGEPISLDPNQPIAEERVRICNYLRSSINALAKSLPTHRVVPFNNIGKEEQTLSK